MSRRSLVARLDWLSILLFLVLVLLGWLNIYSAEGNEVQASIFSFARRSGLQFLWIAAALLLAVFVLLIDARAYYVLAYYIYALGALSLVLVLLFGEEVNGSRSWLALGSMRLQPTEFTKFATALALARLMGRFNFHLNTPRSWALVLLILMLPVGLIVLQNDIGSALVYSAFIIVLYREGMPSWTLLLMGLVVLLFFLELLYDRLYILMGVLAGALLFYSVVTRAPRRVLRMLAILAMAVLVCYVAREFWHLDFPVYFVLLWPALLCTVVFMVWALLARQRSALNLGWVVLLCVATSFSVDYVFHNILDTHHQRRINDMLGIESDLQGWGYNVNQSKIAIGSGGWLGKGYLQGTQTKYSFVPEQSTDFIFCTVGEEWGFLGGAVMIGLFLTLILRIFMLAERQKEPFHRIYGYGVGAVFLFHTAINIAMTIGLFPVIGIPLPFFSYGGSSLWAFTVMLFIFLRFDAVRLH